MGDRQDAAGITTPRNGMAGGHRYSVEMTAGRVFALAAVAVASLALAFNLGRHWPIASSAGSSGRMDEITRRGAVSYEQLEVDRGALSSASPMR
jgi:hypothetical protein